jgi:hypothetical protein
LSRSRADCATSTTRIALRGQRLRINPPMIALAMLPPPMKVMFIKPNRTAKSAKKNQDST